jgi:hypothetical protein
VTPTLSHADGRSVHGLSTFIAATYNIKKKILSILKKTKPNLVKNNI